MSGEQKGGDDRLLRAPSEGDLPAGAQQHQPQQPLHQQQHGEQASGDDRRSDIHVPSTISEDTDEGSSPVSTTTTRESSPAQIVRVVSLESSLPVPTAPPKIRSASVISPAPPPVIGPSLSAHLKRASTAFLSNIDRKPSSSAFAPSQPVATGSGAGNVPPTVVPSGPVDSGPVVNPRRGSASGTFGLPVPPDWLRAQQESSRRTSRVAGPGGAKGETGRSSPSSMWSDLVRQKILQAREEKKLMAKVSLVKEEVMKIVSSLSEIVESNKLLSFLSLLSRQMSARAEDIPPLPGSWLSRHLTAKTWTMIFMFYFYFSAPYWSLCTSCWRLHTPTRKERHTLSSTRSDHNQQ